jgi:glycosyltransferase involved in cell wall biosynthesis
MTTVSYIITVYNKAPCLPELVSSLLNQEGDFEREYIFVDDGSTDDSLKILQDLCAKIPNVTIVSQKNQGPSFAINAGLAKAKGKWLYLADGDDYIYPDATKTLLDAAIINDSLMAGGKHSNNPQKDAWRFDGSITIYSNALEKALQFYTLGAGTLIDRELMLRVGGCDERVFVQDYSIALRISRYTKFVAVHKLTSHNIDSGQQRLSSNKTQENHDTAAARYFFLRENMDIDYRYKYLVLQLFLRKAWKWYIKHNGLKALWSKHFWRYIVSRFDFNFCDRTIMKWMEEGLGVYEGARGGK